MIRKVKVTVSFENGDKSSLEIFDCENNETWLLKSSFIHKWIVKYRWSKFDCYDYESVLKLVNKDGEKEKWKT